MASIKLKIATLEVECEGPEEFLKTELPNFLKLAADTYTNIPAFTPAPAEKEKAHANGNGNGKAPAGTLQVTTETLAAKLGVKNSSDLVLAAASRLAFVDGKESFTREEILAQMRTANAYFRSHHRTNLNRTLSGLVKEGVFNGIAAGTFAFSANSRTEIEGKIRA